MLTLVVTHFDGAPVAAGVKGRFGPLGGTIGAMEGNTIVLPDAGERIAALEANVIATGGGYIIRNCGAHTLQVNAQPVASNGEARLAGGDRVTIGPYALAVLSDGASTAAPIAETRAAETPATPATPPTSSAAAADAAPIAQTQASDNGQSARDELQRAFLEGAGMAHLEIPGGLNPQLMETLGALLRQMTQGTIDLLRIRAEAKSRVHADLTMIGSREINPLKAAWDADVALRHLLAAQRSDMLDPLRAMADACDDLRLHDKGLVAGIHAALDGLLARFNPAELEKRLASQSRFDGLLPGSAKSRRWDSLVELYADLSVEAEQDFWAIFEKEFLQAYTSGRRADTRENKKP